MDGDVLLNVSTGNGNKFDEWNLTIGALGLTGPTGATGDTGPTGATGPTGPAAVNRHSSAAVACTATTIGISCTPATTLDCSNVLLEGPGSIAVGGGCELDNTITSGHGFTVIRPTTTGGFECIATCLANVTGSPTPPWCSTDNSVTAFVLCTDVTP